MKNLIATLCIMTCFNSTVFAGSFTIGGQKIDVPPPTGFVPVTPEMGDIYRLTEQLIDPANDQLAYYISESEASVAKEGKIPLSKQYFILKVSKKLKSAVFGSNEFEKLKNVVKGQNQKIIDKVKTQLPDLFDKVNQGISKEFDMNFAMQVSQVIPLEPHFEGLNAMSFSMYMTYNLKAEGIKEESVMSCTTTFLNTDGKVLFLYCYAPQDELKWTRTASKAWADAIIASNPKPPIKSSGASGLGRNKRMLIWIVVGFIVALLSIAKKMIAKKSDKKMA